MTVGSSTNVSRAVAKTDSPLALAAPQPRLVSLRKFCAPPGAVGSSRPQPGQRQKIQWLIVWPTARVALGPRGTPPAPAPPARSRARYRPALAAPDPASIPSASAPAGPATAGSPDDR